MKHICPACGYDELDEPAYDEYGSPSFNIFPSCGFQFGKTDDDEHFTFEQWRQLWISKGMPWSSKRDVPENWNPARLLMNVIKDFKQ